MSIKSCEPQLSTKIHIFDGFFHQNLAIGFDVFYRYHFLKKYQSAVTIRVEQDRQKRRTKRRFLLVSLVLL